uniref:Uncharacterized protein n=1 Tax=Rhizophagus irregularis (strain DAOM 181602 / DAOM 197198 / MUCL 43194) TaxID=747089 RepID=U9T6M2_RHIID
MFIRQNIHSAKCPFFGEMELDEMSFGETTSLVDHDVTEITLKIPADHSMTR